MKQTKIVAHCRARRMMSLGGARYAATGRHGSERAARRYEVLTADHAS
ncbi:MAG TPA: hypothetical protein VJ464_09915 [Blastocatellia bacterium]|nr:hypothetical protein [Blastocatellia bacterium]